MRKIGRTIHPLGGLGGHLTNVYAKAYPANHSTSSLNNIQYSDRNLRAIPQGVSV